MFIGLPRFVFYKPSNFFVHFSKIGLFVFFLFDYLYVLAINPLPGIRVENTFFPVGIFPFTDFMVHFD